MYPVTSTKDELVVFLEVVEVTICGVFFNARVPVPLGMECVFSVPEVTILLVNVLVALVIVNLALLPVSIVTVPEVISTESPAPLVKADTVVKAVIVLTSMTSPLAGASVNVSVVPETAYAVVGVCTVPLILTITLAALALAPRVNATVLLSPEKLCVVIVAVSSPTLTQLLPL